MDRQQATEAMVGVLNRITGGEGGDSFGSPEATASSLELFLIGDFGLDDDELEQFALELEAETGFDCSAQLQEGRDYRLREVLDWLCPELVKTSAVAA